MGRLRYRLLLIAITLHGCALSSATPDGQEERYSVLLKELQDIREKLHIHSSQLQEIENQTADMKIRMKDVQDNKEIKVYEEHRQQQRTTLPTTDVAFYTYLNNDIPNLSNNKIIIFDHVGINKYKSYRNNIGVFVSPVSGMYIFHVSIVVGRNDDNAVEVQMVKNSSPVLGLYAGSSHYNGVSNNMILVELQKDDQVWVQVSGSQNDGIVLKQGFTTFSGFLLYKI